MAEVTVSSQLVGSSYFPPICARHGGPSTRWKERDFHSKTPGWVIVLAVLSLLIGAIIALAIRKTVHSRLPACDACRADRRRFALLVVGAWVGVVVTLVLAAAINNPIAFIVWLLLLVGALVFSFMGELFRVRGYLTRDQAVVVMKGVSPQFAQAIRDAGYALPS
ncbi:MAG: hypothetical protein ABR520_07170 [Mycobacteriales bacterium]|nr:hypothetical protein [Frankia sp.]